MTLEEFYERHVPVETKKIESQSSLLSFLKKGYYPVEILVIFRHDLQKISKRKIQYEVATKKNDIVLGTIARKNMNLDRFHRDPSISNIIADKFYREWGRDLVRRNKEVLIIKVQGKIAGFLGYKEENNNARIDLFIVDKKYQGQGIGKKLLQVFLSKCKGKYAYALTGTSAINLPAIRAYGKCGFKFFKTQTVLHKWRELK